MLPRMKFASKTTPTDRHMEIMATRDEDDETGYKFERLAMQNRLKTGNIPKEPVQVLPRSRKTNKWKIL